VGLAIGLRATAGFLTGWSKDKGDLEACEKSGDVNPWENVARNTDNKTQRQSLDVMMTIVALGKAVCSIVE